VLLDLYRYSPDTRDELIEIFEKCANRLWVPHQVAYEYLTKRSEVILTQVSIYDKAKKIIQTLVNHAQEEINKYFTFRLHPFLEKEDFLGKIKTALAEVDNEIDEKKQEHPDLLKKDHIWDTITTLLKGKVGSPYPDDKLKKIYEEGKIRYSKDVPPGYEDSRGANKKKGENIYGDLVIWFQIIEKAKEEGKPIIFITNDNKEDWWWISKGKTLGCRPELTDEMTAKANVLFYMYNSDRFMSYSQEHLKIEIKQEAIDEVRDIRLFNLPISSSFDPAHGSYNALKRIIDEKRARIEAIKQMTETYNATKRIIDEERARIEVIKQMTEPYNATKRIIDEERARIEAIKQMTEPYDATKRIIDEERARIEAIKQMTETYNATKSDLGSISESSDDVDEHDDPKKQE